MKQRYLDLMEIALSAYTPEHILEFFDQVKANGLDDQAFPRLTANIGILLAGIVFLFEDKSAVRRGE